MILGAGGSRGTICPVQGLRAAGSPVGLGCDGSSSNDAASLWLESRTALLLVVALDLLAAGCGGPARFQTHGRILKNGEPFRPPAEDAVRVTLEPVPEPGEAIAADLKLLGLATAGR